MRQSQTAVQAPSRTLLRFFDVYLARFMPRHFHALRLAHAERWQSAGRPLIVCLNHPSWWDPLVCIQLSRFLSRSVEHFAPIDAIAMERYRILRRLGLFAVEQGTPRGAAQFLRSAAAILRRPHAVLWLTPQGSFTDIRKRPMVFRAGLDALLRREEQVTVLPLAIEYTFWNERLPEALAMLGEPLVFARGLPATRTAQQQAGGAAVAAALTRTQDALAALAIERNAAAFTTIFACRQGTGGIYGLWQRLRSTARGEGMHPEHASLTTAAAPVSSDPESSRALR